MLFGADVSLQCCVDEMPAIHTCIPGSYLQRSALVTDLGRRVSSLLARVDESDLRAGFVFSQAIALFVRNYHPSMHEYCVWHTSGGGYLIYFCTGVVTPSHSHIY